ncbi:MAG TPA: response regulator [Polyangiales bacterium]|nr:response regulator [Polyangiales bacterium]
MNRVLIVDDVRENLYLLRILLEGHGYAVDEASHGREALQYARQKPPQLIVSDLLMPVMDGYELLREWKADPQLKSIPFIVYTATYTGTKDERLAFDLGADGFITKSTEPQEFMSRMQQVLNRATRGELSPPQLPNGQEQDLLARYSQILIRKLERKAQQLVAASRTLQEDVARRERAEAAAKEAERAREQALEAVRHKSVHLEEALNMAGMGVWRWDLRSDEFSTLDGHGPVTGLPAADYPATGQAFFALVHPDDRALVEEKVERAKRGEEYDAEFRIVLSSGAERWVAVRGRCVHNGSEERCVLTGLDQDITERKTLEERLRHKQRMEAIGQLAGGIAHDFNNILAAIIGNAHLARMDLPVDNPALASVEEILRAGQRAKDLTQRILTFSRPAAYQLKPIQLQPILEEAERLLRATLPAGVDLSFQADARLPPVRADASQIHQVVLNLVTNAWQALRGQPGRIETRLEYWDAGRGTCSEQSEMRCGPCVKLSVRDTGAGMDEATLQHMYEPFFTTKPPGKGAGLGLSVVHGIVRGHGGAIFAESQLGKGTTFNVYFPACPEGTVAVRSERKAVRDVRGHGEQILYIDDEESLVYLAVRFLQRGGYRVEGFTRAQEALAAYRARPRSYDIVITDYNMPGMSGMELAQHVMRIRADARVALTSGYLRPAEIQAAQALGICEVIPKPYLVEELGPIVERMLTSSSSQRTAG